MDFFTSRNNHYLSQIFRRITKKFSSLNSKTPDKSLIETVLFACIFVLSGTGIYLVYPRLADIHYTRTLQNINIPIDSIHALFNRSPYWQLMNTRTLQTESTQFNLPNHTTHQISRQIVWISHDKSQIIIWTNGADAPSWVGYECVSCQNVIGTDAAFQNDNASAQYPHHSEYLGYFGFTALQDAIRSKRKASSHTKKTKFKRDPLLIHY